MPDRSNDVAGAYRYTRARGAEVTTISAATGHDRVFHIAIEEPPPQATIIIVK